MELLNQTGSTAAVRQIASAGLSHGQALQQFEAMIQGQAVMLATDRLFLTLSGLLLAAACSVWFIAKPAGRAGGGAASAAH